MSECGCVQTCQTSAFSLRHVSSLALHSELCIDVQNGLLEYKQASVFTWFATRSCELSKAVQTTCTHLSCVICEHALVTFTHNSAHIKLFLYRSYVKCSYTAFSIAKLWIAHASLLLKHVVHLGHSADGPCLLGSYLPFNTWPQRNRLASGFRRCTTHETLCTNFSKREST